MNREMMNRFIAIYLIERYGGSKNFLKLLGGKILDDSAKPRPGFVKVELLDHNVEVYESALLNALLLGYEPKIKHIVFRGARSKLVLECIGIGLGDKETFALLNKYGVQVSESLVSTVKSVLKKKLKEFDKKS